MTVTYCPGGPAGAIRGEVRPRATHREIEEFLVRRISGLSKSKARRIARAVAAEPNPFEAALDRSRVITYPDPTGETAVRNVMRQEH